MNCHHDAPQQPLPVQAVQKSQEAASQAERSQEGDASSSAQVDMQAESQSAAHTDAQSAAHTDAQSAAHTDAQSAARTDAQMAAARKRGTLERQLRGLAERISLAGSRLQVEDAASSLTALEQLYQVCCRPQTTCCSWRHSQPECVLLLSSTCCLMYSRSFSDQACFAEATHSCTYVLFILFFLAYWSAREGATLCIMLELHLHMCVHLCFLA